MSDEADSLGKVRFILKNGKNCAIRRIVSDFLIKRVKIINQFAYLVAERYPDYQELQKYTKLNLKLLETQPYLSKQILAHPFIKNIMRRAEDGKSNGNSHLKHNWAESAKNHTKFL